METLFESSNLILFFSLPFKPAGAFNLFFNGHIALALDSTVYHIVNPNLLKTDFLFSIMPVDSWLFGSGGKWVDRDPASPGYTHVYLYRKSESVRTVVYAAGVTVDTATLQTVKQRFLKEDTLFKEGKYRYHLLSANCSSIIADALVEVGLVQNKLFNILPAALFRHFVTNNSHHVTLRTVSQFDRIRFVTHHFCYGLWGFNPQRIMDRWMASINPYPA
jgi:hypothetical protein